MTAPLNKTRSNLGDLGAMSDTVQASERSILKHGEAMLTENEKTIKRLRPLAIVGGDADSQSYQEAILERARLQKVIAQAQQILGGDVPEKLVNE